MPSSPSPTDPIVAVAVPVPGLGLLSYRVPGRARPPAKGARVEVPLGTRVVIGCVVDPDAQAPPDGVLRDVRAVLDDEPFLPPAIVDLALWVGEYYASGPGDALTVAMPPAARRGDRDPFKKVAVASLTPAGAAGPDVRGPRQSEALAVLQASPDGMELPTLARLGITGATIKTLVRDGLVALRQDVVERDPFEGLADGYGRWSIDRAVDHERVLTDEQDTALVDLSRAASARRFETVLFHGVTGSGKTEVYLRLAARVLADGRSVLILVPEIALTPALAGLFRSRFGSRVAIQHSGLAAGERHDQWHRIRRGDVHVVVGTRSAVFAPLHRLGLVVVDEEHESSYKQEESPRYHARDVAVVRGRMEGALVVLGSATPSLESATNARQGKYRALRLTRRVLGRPLATVDIVDMRQEMAASGGLVTLSRPLLAGLADRLERREQALVLLNRRGFATVIFCRSCGASLECPHCSVNLTYHRRARRVRCHYCNYAAGVPKHCGECGGEYLEHSGFGTERLEADLRERFASARIARVDRDTVRRKGAIAEVLHRVAQGEIDILVGTQMIAKGHDFPAVTLVGVVSADIGLGLADFRAAERTFQLLTQVVGRAGRGETAGQAIVQTLYPDHYSVRAAALQDYELFYGREMEFRRGLHYPPAVALINVIVRGPSLERAMADAHELAQAVRQRGGGRVVGPAPAPLARLKDEHRAQFFIKSNRGSSRSAMREALFSALEARPDLKRRVVVDVDPVSVI